MPPFGDGSACMPPYMSRANAATVNANDREAVRPDASFTWTVKLKVPSIDGMPERTPLEAESATPDGSEPDVTLQEKGDVPPLVTRVAL